LGVSNLVISTDLDRAAAVIETRGWTQHHYYRRTEADGPSLDLRTTAAVCLIGGLCAAINDGDPRPSMLVLDGPEWDRYYEAEGVLTCELGQGPCMWNDEDGRTAEQVIAFLRTTAANLRSQSESA
jgi:hypothetical protein